MKDWKSNQWVGVGALAIMIAGVSVVIWHFVHRPPPPRAVGLTFTCGTCGKTFTIEQPELNNLKTYTTYMNKYGEAVPCRLCGAQTAYQSYYCPTCEKYYRYTKGDGVREFIRCPETHEIPAEDQ